MSFLFFSTYSPADDWVQPICNALNVPTDQVKYFVSAVAMGPLCYALRFLPNNTTLKHIMYGVIGAIMTYLLFGMEVISVLFTTVPVYIVMKYWKTHKAAGILLVYVFGYLLYRHIYLYFNMYLVWTLEFTTTHMILTLKLTGFAFSVANGASDEKLCDYLEEHKIKKYPSLLEFFGFVFFFPGLFSGPTLEYREYIEFIEMTRFKSIGGKLPPVPWVSFCMNYFGGIAMYFVYAYINSNPLPDPEYYILQHPETCGLGWKLLTIWWTVSTLRIKYYGTWKLTESFGEISGCGFKCRVEQDGKTYDDYSIFVNIHIIEFEICRSAKHNIDIWNMYVQRWLKYYVYTALIKTSLKKYATSLTMLTSAFWHGVYPGYYLTFLALGFDKDVSNLIYKRLDPYMEKRFGKGSLVWYTYDVVLRIFNSWHLNYAVYPFMRFEFLPSLIAIMRTYAIGYVVPALIYVWLKYMPPHIPGDEKKEQVKKVD